MDPIRYESVEYDRAAHEGFVKSSWCFGARLRWEILASYLRRPDTRCLVAHVPERPDDLLGWAAVDAAAKAVIWAYTRELYGRVRGRGLATSLLLEMGIDVSEPTPCLFWSPAAAEIAARGYRIYFAPRRERNASQGRSTKARLHACG